MPSVLERLLIMQRLTLTLRPRRPYRSRGGGLELLVNIVDLLSYKNSRGTCFRRKTWPVGVYVVIRKPAWSDRLRMYKDRTDCDEPNDLEWSPLVCDLIATDWELYQ